jgi:hypothetical protein
MHKDRNNDMRGFVSYATLKQRPDLGAVDLIENLCGEIARAVYTQASISTHVQTAMQEVQQMKRYLDAVLFDILEIGGKN